MTFTQLSSEVILEQVQSMLSNPKGEIEGIFKYPAFERTQEWQKTFANALQIQIKEQNSIYPYFRDLCQRYQFKMQAPLKFQDLHRIPGILTSVLKEVDISNHAVDATVLTVESSGTSGRKSKLRMDEITLLRIIAGVIKVYSEMGLSSTTPSHYLFFGYSPQATSNAATAGTDQVVSHLTPKISEFYALDLNTKGHVKFQRKRTIEYLKNAIDSGQPLRCLGFLHFFCDCIEGYYQKYGKANFPEGSLVLSGGGWKDSVSKYGSGFDFFSFLKMHTNLLNSQVRDSYSLAEHPILFVQCEKNEFHIPSLSEVIIRDPETLEMLPTGSVGLIQLLTPLVSSFPSASILTTDYGATHTRCSCTRKSPILRLHGRAGRNKQITCAIQAEQFLEIKNDI